MTTQPFQPNDESDRLNTTLDALATGTRAPETGPASEDDSLTATARLINGQPAEAGEYPSDDTLDTIWRHVMQSQSHAVTAQEPFTSFSPNGTAFEDRIANVPPRPESARLASWLSVAAMVALLVGLVGGAWGVRQSGGDDGNPIRLAATVLDETPEASPSSASKWLTWVQPEECTVEPMTTEEYGEIMRQEPDISGRSYELVGPADPAMAEAVANAARAHEACTVYGDVTQQWALESDAFVFYRSASIERTMSQPEIEALNREHAMLLSETMPAKEPGAYAEILAQTPPDELIGYMRTQGGASQLPVFLSLAYDPENAMELEDGRVAIPATILYWSGGNADEWYQVEQWQIDESTSLFTFIVILNDHDGKWKVDEQLGFCPFKDCDLVRDQTAPSATPEPSNGLLPLPGTPVASPEG